MKRNLIAFSLALAITAAAPASAQMFKWVDANGVTHYSDRKPDDPKNAGKVNTVNGAVSVYSPDSTLVQAVEQARRKAAEPAPAEAERPRPAYAAAAPAPQSSDPCLEFDCGTYYYPAAGAGHFRRRPLPQAHLKPGATAGTVNSPGIIPGNTGTTGQPIAAVPDFRPPREPARGAPRGRPQAGHGLEPQAAFR